MSRDTCCVTVAKETCHYPAFCEPNPVGVKNVKELNEIALCSGFKSSNDSQNHSYVSGQTDEDDQM